MDNQDKLFDTLRRSPLGELEAALDAASHDNIFDTHSAHISGTTPPEWSPKFQAILKEHGWTEKEYLDESIGPGLDLS